MPGMDRAHGVGGTPDGLLGQLGGVGEPARLAGDRAQAEALCGVERGGLQPAVVERQRLALPVLQEQLAVIGTVQGAVDDPLNTVGVEAGAGEEQVVGGGAIGHGSAPGGGVA
jgi:hypothetical protein